MLVNLLLRMLNIGVKLCGMKLSEYILISKVSAASLADRLEVTPATVSYWVSGNRRPDIANCKRIEFATGGKVRCEDLRPELNWEFIRNSRDAA